MLPSKRFRVQPDIWRLLRKIEGRHFVETLCCTAWRFLTRTRSAEPAAPTPFKKFRHRELAQQNADTAIAGMAGRTTIPPPFPVAVLDRPVPTLLPSEATTLAVEEALSFSPRVPLLFRAAKASATTAFAKQQIGGGRVKGIEHRKHESR